MNTTNVCSSPHGEKCCPCIGVAMTIGLIFLLAGVCITLYIAVGPYRHIVESRAALLPSDVVGSVSEAVAFAWWGAGLSLVGSLLLAVSLLMRWREKRKSTR
jgi:hypothetical protein